MYHQHTGGTPRFTIADVEKWPIEHSQNAMNGIRGRLIWRVHESKQKIVADVLEQTQSHHLICSDTTVVSGQVYGISTRSSAPSLGNIHTDYPDDSWAWLRKAAESRPGMDSVYRVRMPWSGLWSPLAKFKIAIFKHEERCEDCEARVNGPRFCPECPHIMVTVPENHVIFLAANTWHAGGPHQGVRWRFHGYGVDTRFMSAPRGVVYD